jgi:DNA-directed RNA polymerase subunit RPC12/RpoP
MGHKVVCLDCRISFSQGTDINDRRDAVCPDCSKQMILLPHRFRPPKKTEVKKWEIVKYLIEKGFYYQHIYETVETRGHINRPENYVEYPDNLRDAKVFVEKYKSQARK